VQDAPAGRSVSEVEREGDMPDRDMHKLCVIAPSRQSKRSHRLDGEYNKLINDGLRVCQEREQGGSDGAAWRRPEFYAMSPGAGRVCPCICSIFPAFFCTDFWLTLEESKPNASSKLKLQSLETVYVMAQKE
jgi:hypothetical protein